MGRDWYDRDEPIDELLEPAPSKTQLRAEADALVASYRGPVRRLPTYAALRFPRRISRI